MSIISREIGRGNTSLGITVAVTASAATTGTIDFSEYAGGCIYVPTGSSLTSLTFHIAPKYDGTYLAAYDDSSLSAPAAVVLTVSAAKAYPLPACLYGAGAFKMVGDTTGTVYVTLKA